MRNQKIKILHCAETLKGGIATYLNTILPCQTKELEYEIALLGPKSHINEINKIYNLKTFYFFNSKRVFNIFFLSIIFIKTFIKFKPDIIHLHSTIPGLSLRIITRIISPKTKIIYCSHGWAWDRTEKKPLVFIYKKLELILSYLTDKIICISKYELNEATKFGLSKNKLTLIVNGVEPPNFINKSYQLWEQSEKIKVLFVGRFDEQKGVDIFLKAMEGLQNEVSAIMIGETVLKTSPSLFNFNIKNVKKVGWIKTEEISTYYSQADVLIMPSRWEGFGLVAAEAMSNGLPVIASNKGALPEIITHEKTGFILKENTAHEIIQVIKKTNKNALNNMRAACTENYLKNFTSSRMNKEIIDIYKTIKD